MPQCSPLLCPPPRRVPDALKNRLKDELERLEALGVITKVTKPTDLVSNLVVAEKPNGKLRVCIDPQHLSHALKRSRYPLPINEDILPDLGDVKVFSKVDLKEGQMDPEFTRKVVITKSIPKADFEIKFVDLHAFSASSQDGIAALFYVVVWQESNNSQVKSLLVLQNFTTARKSGTMF